MNESAHLTVASYKENLDWVDKVQCAVTVYNVGGLGIGIPLPNVAREASQYMHSIITRYHEFRPYEIFCQGNPFDHCRNFLDQLNGETYVNKGWHGFGKLYRIKWENIDKGQMHRNLQAAAFYRSFFNKPSTPLIQWSVGAQFSVSRERLLSHPLSYYERLQEKILAEKSSPWAVERLWPALI